MYQLIILSFMRYACILTRRSSDNLNEWKREKSQFTFLFDFLSFCSVFFRDVLYGNLIGHNEKQDKITKKNGTKQNG